MNPLFGQLVLAAHLAIIAFNIAGLVLIPLGAALGWRWVRVMWWRLLHLASLAATAVQAPHLFFARSPLPTLSLSSRCALGGEEVLAIGGRRSTLPP